MNNIISYWINANLFKPDPDERVLVYSEHYAKYNSSPYHFGRYIASLDEWRIDSDNNAWIVTHWSRPQKPQESQQELPKIVEKILPRTSKHLLDQNEIVKLMKEGWELWSGRSIRGNNYWCNLQKNGAHKGGETKKIHKSTLKSMLKNNIIVERDRTLTGNVYYILA